MNSATSLGLALVLSSCAASAPLDMGVLAESLESIKAAYRDLCVLHETPREPPQSEVCLDAKAKVNRAVALYNGVNDELD